MTNLMGQCATLLVSPKLTASELMAMTYGKAVGDVSGGGEDADPGNMRETMAIGTPSVRFRARKGQPLFSTESAHATPRHATNRGAA